TPDEIQTSHPASSLRSQGGAVQTSWLSRQIYMRFSGLASRSLRHLPPRLLCFAKRLDHAHGKIEPRHDTIELGIFAGRVNFATLKAHRLQHRRPRIIWIPGIARIGPEAHHPHFEAFADLTVYAARDSCQVLARHIAAKGRPPVLDGERYLGLGDELVFHNG